MNVWSKLDLLVKHFEQKVKFWIKSEIFTKNPNVKAEFFFVKNRNFGQNLKSKFEKSKFCQKSQFFIKNSNFCQKS